MSTEGTIEEQSTVPATKPSTSTAMNGLSSPAVSNATVLGFPSLSVQVGGRTFVYISMAAFCPFSSKVVYLSQPSL